MRDDQRRTQARSRSSQGRRSSSYDEARARSDRSRSSRTGSGRRQGPGRPFPILLIILFGVVVIRLVQLQVVQADWLSSKAASLHSVSVTISARRGTIYDRNGNVLAASDDCTTLYCNPNAIESSKKTQVAAILANRLGGDANEYLETLNQDTTFAYLEKKADPDAVDLVVSDLAEAEISGIYTLAESKRVYPYGSLAGQVLGFVGTDGDGISGLEYYYDDVLSGTDGEMQMEQGLDGNPVAGAPSTILAAIDGQDIITSLDINLQETVEEQLTQAVSDASAQSGSVVVTDPSTGEILACASTPLYDPTNSESLTDEALKLSCVSDSYEPGSTFKILTMAIGYDTSTITTDTVFSVPAEVKVGDDYVSDDDGRDYTMDMTPYEIMRRSSNAGAALVGQALGADKLADGLARLGIGQKTGIDFPGEVEGIVTAREDYTSATTGAVAFGQAIAIPAIQLVRAVGAVANGGVLTVPHFLVQKGDEVVDWGEGTQAVSAEAASLVTQDMVGVVEEGTGTKAQIEGYTVAGKTGTGEQASSEGGYTEDSFMSSFIGFANADDPEVLVYVGINGTAQHGGTAAAPYFSAIMSEALSDVGVRAGE